MIFRALVLAGLAAAVILLFDRPWYIGLIVALSAAIAVLVALLYMAMRWP